MVTSSALLDPLRKGAERAARRTLVSVTSEVEIEDPVAVAFASRLASERWFCWEQPDREFALAGIGVAHEAASRGARRFDDVAAECSRVGRDRVVEEPIGLPAGAGAVWLGGFAFDPEGGDSPTWSSLAPASLVLPEISLCRSAAADLDDRQRGGRPRRRRRSGGPRSSAPAWRRCARRRRCR